MFLVQWYTAYKHPAAASNNAYTFKLLISNASNSSYNPKWDQLIGKV